MVDNQNHVAGVVDNRAFGAHLVIVKLQQRTVAVDTADAENAEVETELGDEVQRRLADDTAIAASQLTASQNNAKIFFHHQRIGHVKVVGHDAQIAVIKQRVGHRFRRRSDVDKQRRAVRDLACHLLCNTLFLGRLRRFSIVPRGVYRARRQRRAAVVAQDFFLFRKVIQIATNGLGADRKVLHQLFRTDIALEFDQFDYRVMTLCLFHDESLENYARFRTLSVSTKAIARPITSPVTCAPFAIDIPKTLNHPAISQTNENIISPRGRKMPLCGSRSPRSQA